MTTNIRHIIAVGSGKGGVGKSTTAVNIALSLARKNAKVGLLDADIYGPNQPRMLGINAKPELIDNHFQPISAHGIVSMSMGYLVADNTPMIWRGPMVTKALYQLLYQTNWGQLDYLLIDLPPGTGDVQLSLIKKSSLSGAIIVTTPQSIATDDAKKGLEMFVKMQVPVLGVVENMSQHVCSVCQHVEAIFGEQGGKDLADQSQVPFLAALPLDKSIRIAADEGVPIVAAKPDSKIAASYHAIAESIIKTLALKT